MEPDIPRDFTVQDILDAGGPAPGSRARHQRDARSALWEIDFALQELEWLGRGPDRPGSLIESIISQVGRAARTIIDFPLDALPLDDELAAELADRFSRLGEAVRALPPAWADHEHLHAALRRLRHELEVRDVETGT